MFSFCSFLIDLAVGLKPVLLKVFFISDEENVSLNDALQYKPDNHPDHILFKNLKTIIYNI